jgi:hypothetical protein
MENRIANTKLLVDRTALLHRIPKNLVACEVGVAFGDFSQLIMEICQPRKLFLIDSWNFQGRYDNTALNKVNEKFVEDIASGCVEIIRADSLGGMTQLADQSVDFLYLDTDHTYATTKKELAIAALKVKPDGFIAGHDYKSQGRFDAARKKFIKYGVIEAVQEFMVNDVYDLVFLTNEPHGYLSYALKKSMIVSGTSPEMG